MPIIYTYPTVTPVLEDLLLLSDVSDVRTTKTAAISSVLGLGLTTTKVTLSAAEVIALNITPITLIGAPGVGKALIVLDFKARLNFNSVPFNKGELRIYQNRVDRYTHFINQAWRQTASSVTGLSEISGIYDTTWGENFALEVISNLTGGGGDSTIDLYITYKTITL